MPYIILIFFLPIGIGSQAYGQSSPRVCSVGPDGTIYPAVEYYYDHDGDGAIESSPTVWLCSESLPNTLSAYPVGTIELTEDNFDCAPGDPVRFQPQYVYGPDNDGDGYPSVVGEPFRICVGYSKTPAYLDWDMQGMGGNPFVDCDDNDITVPIGFVYVDSDGDGAADNASQVYHCENENVTGKPYISSMVPGIYNGYPWPVESSVKVQQDCAINNPAIQAGVQFFRDNDADGLGSGEPETLCGEILNGLMGPVSIPVGYSVSNTDCNDNNSKVGVECSLKWNWDPYYDSETKRKLIIVQQYPVDGKGFDVNLQDFLIYDGDDRDNLIFEVICNFCSNVTLDGSIYRGPIVADTISDFHLLAGRKSALVRVTNKFGTSASANVDFEIVTGQAVLYVNGILTELYETKGGLHCDQPKPDGSCNFGADGALRALRSFVENHIRLLVQHLNFDSLVFELAYNPTRGLGHDVFLESLEAWLADKPDGFISVIQNGLIKLSKFGDSSEIEEKAPGFMSDFSTKVLNKSVEKLNSENVPLSDFKGVYRKIEGLIRSGFRVTVVSHSQGNFLSNQAYADLSDFQRKYVNQVHVATPASYNADKSNRFVSLINDPVARLAMPLRLPNASGGELSCVHNFIDCYLGFDPNNGPDSASKIKSNIIESVLDFNKRFELKE